MLQPHQLAGELLVMAMAATFEVVIDVAHLRHTSAGDELDVALVASR
ncbi:MAG: hypothetical protein AAFY28_11325 [Actinomycetota bacterium]